MFFSSLLQENPKLFCPPWKIYEYAPGYLIISLTKIGKLKLNVTTLTHVKAAIQNSFFSRVIADKQKDNEQWKKWIKTNIKYLFAWFKNRSKKTSHKNYFSYMSNSSEEQKSFLFKRCSFLELFMRQCSFLLMNNRREFEWCSTLPHVTLFGMESRNIATLRGLISILDSLG